MTAKKHQNKSHSRRVPWAMLIFFSLTLMAIATAIYLFRFRENTLLTQSPYTFGIDVSHYQGEIDWDDVKESHHPIEFVFVRATMGKDGKDKYFDSNFQEAKNKGYVTGAYHYYRPNEDAEEQFENFNETIALDSGDLLPVLDIEELGIISIDSLRKSLQTWLRLAEEDLGVKPIIYTGRTFYFNYLKGHFDDYPLWIASYSEKHKIEGIDWVFHQFTDKVRVNGIEYRVDGNDFNGSLDELKSMYVINPGI